jgi:hypothetical protein
MAVDQGGTGVTGLDPMTERRILARWPRLERSALRRCGHDPRRIAALIGRRTSLPPDAILRLLTMPDVGDDDVRLWFG